MNLTVTTYGLPEIVTDQSLFDKASLHLITQGAPAVDKDGICAYRGKDDTACGVGCLISDIDYDVSLEGRPSYDPAVRAALRVDTQHNDLLAAIQNLHDREFFRTGMDEAFDIEHLKKKLGELAARFGLSDAVLN